MVPWDVNVITKFSHPTLFRAFEKINHDKGAQAGHHNYVIPMQWSLTTLNEVEGILYRFAKTRPRLFDILCIGEETKTQQIVKEFPFLYLTDNLLQRFFEEFE